jgi:hypothetical protein
MQGNDMNSHNFEIYIFFFEFVGDPNPSTNEAFA